MDNKWLEIESSKILPWMQELLNSGQLRLLSTITGYQDGDKVCLVYHIIKKDGVVNMRTCLPLSNPILNSVSAILPAAVLYEREIQDLLGVKFEGIIDGRRSILPENFSEGVYPLRKDFKPSPPKED